MLGFTLLFRLKMRAVPVDGSLTPLPSLDQAHQPSQALWPLSGQVYNLTLPDHDEQVLLDEWCRSEHVALPFTDLPAPDGSLLALNEEELRALSDHIISGHVTKSNLCKSFLEAEGLEGHIDPFVMWTKPPTF